MQVLKDESGLTCEKAIQIQYTAPSGFVRFDPAITGEEIDEIIDKAFKPIIDKIKHDRAIFEEYYRCNLNMAKFALKKQVTYPQMRNLCKKYGLPAKLSRPKITIIDDNAERADFDGKHYRY